MPKKLKVGIAGYGIVGKRRHQYINLNPHFETIAVCDQYFKGTGTLKNGILYFSTFHELLQQPLDVLFVSLPNYLAPEVTIAGLERGMHIFCEKPPGHSIESVQLVQKAKNKYPSQKLKYGFNHRYHKSVKDALKIVRSKELGEVINLRGIYGKSGIIPFQGNWRAERKYAGGGILLDQGIHMVDLIRLYCGDFYEIQSFVSNDFFNCDVEDNAFAIMRDQQGRIAMLHSTATQWQHLFSLDIFLSGGYLRLRGILAGSKSYGQEELIVGKKNDLATGSDREEVITYLEDNSWRDEINEFADAIIDGKEIQIGTVEEAIDAMKIVFRIYWADSKWREKMNIPNPNVN